MLTPVERIEVSSGFGISRISRSMFAKRCHAFSEEAAEQPDEVETPLDDAAQGERQYVRQRLREELKREPTESELDDWLRQHTEGY